MAFEAVRVCSGRPFFTDMPFLSLPFALPFSLGNFTFLVLFLDVPF